MIERPSKLVAALAALYVVQGSSLIAKPADAAVLQCAHTVGYVQGPFVPTEAFAHKLFGVYLDQFSPGRRDPELHRVVVVDGGDRWKIHEDNRVRDKRGRAVSLMGGAGMAMEIDKCTGAVLSATHVR